MSKYPELNSALSSFNDMQSYAQRNVKTVDAFIRSIKYMFRKESRESFCQESYFIRYGSNRERTVVTDDADFDFIMVLPQPFTTDNFFPVEYEPGVFSLHLKDRFSGLEEHDEYLTPRNPRRLRVFNLRKSIFDSLEHCVCCLAEQWTNWEFSCRRILTNFKVTLTDKNGQRGNVVIDIIPQIGVNLLEDDIPGCRCHSCDLPDVFHGYMHSYNYSAFYVLAFPPHLQKCHIKNLLVQVNFGLLELCSIQYSGNIRNTVRLCKSISLKSGLRKYGLHHYHIKRMAISLLEFICDADPYDGMEMVFQGLYDCMRINHLCGYFIEGQDLYERNESQRQVVCNILEDVLDNIKNHDFSDLFDD